ncbi:1-deoxy-D-xylulose-5-phosphate synthase [Laribacter hongkongensis]|uniref:1-deoxy-D-xylulose-5-phosphate synthase n=1 Tax=Laribacter hongkongensis TaxID=168471 RepID=UPI001EFD0777|nr:1-deoxy-D-xylulose-5-phosphate synthase [Laribacter hongkongensis]MCG9031459.1 1-deoxy-D-xylulose-5-phosphate synthase [Laribacter hongkongensis]MCG9091417.1 1-deoxy-D-xylulose-5-phosphate synthase [Laribacter hongkongensis]
MTSTPLLDTIQIPADLRELDRKQLPQLARELRDFLVDSVSQTGGHFASNLGSIELTIALHYVYNTPDDRLVWDVGHQTYPHKILTGRRDRMHTMRQKGGLAGFPKRDESEYDTFGVGHSSTSIGAALGMAVAARQTGSDRRVVAIIGDGAMTAGQAFEALNNAGDSDTDLLVILNDNDMSISPNVGALNHYFTRLMSGRFYATMKSGTNRVLGMAPPLQKLAHKAEEQVKGLLTPATLFEEFGFNYLGPVDGHDLGVLVNTLQNIRQLKGPQFLHVVTKKGHGYKLAEKDPISYHGVSKFSPENGLVSKSGSSKPGYTQVFGDWLCDMAAQDERLVGITPAMREGSGMVRFEKEYPDRYFDVGIAEQHAVTFAAGMACDGLKPVVAIYSTFLQRAYDQLIHDVALQNLPVVFAIDRAGLVGADGPTHAGAFDLSYLRCIPNMVVMAPSDENECRQLLYTAFLHDGPTAVRYPRGTGPGCEPVAAMTALPLGQGTLRRQGKGIAILAFGSMVHPALAAADQLDASVADMRFVKPLDTALIRQLAASHELLVTVEENVVMGGAGSAVLETLAAAGITVPVLNLGLPDHYVEHGDPALLLADCGLDAAGIVRSVRQRLDDTVSGAA